MKLTCLTAKYGMATEVSGHAKTCCLANQQFVDSSGNPMTFDAHGPEEIWKSDHRRKILSDLENGIQHPNCTVCWQEEAVGRPSKRLRETEYWEKYETQITDITGPETPFYLDLKLGNTCNLRCRTCNSVNSSSWMTEEYEVKHANTNLTKKQFLSRFDIIKNSYSEENEELWETLEEWIPKSKKIDFYGGEPFLIEKPWKLLHKCVETGVSKEQSLHCNTNTTIIPSKEQEQVIVNFKEVDLSLSIDGIGSAFEYMRYPAKWNEVLSNIDYFFDLKRKHDNINITFCYTISIMNIHH
ncbi:twitch domain-containing radical SAM protein, partial [bacterium]|nr:twitch domain-containing radical SAM protein [bacterium]